LLPLLDFGFDNAGCIFLVRPAIEGEHLSTRLPRWNEGLSSETFWATLPRLVHALSAACAAVACAHEHGFIHRSLGPPAIFLGSRKEEVFVVAWDCAASADCPAEEGLLVGRPAYIAPEQVQSPETVTPSADVWGLGGILYVLLFGRPPNVPSGTQESTLEIIRCAVEPKTRGVLRPGLLPDRAVQLSSSGFFARLFGAARLGTPLPIQALEDICLRALEIEPSRRQPSMAALAAELDGWLARYGDPLPE
jgi:serine/threonine protein kinase